ncbi:hypothetical protein DIPPA_00127 [Diplonema papillatum]|nr:hypothetical protein DIPPA_00127 [Diplonema papillatum]
MEVPLTIDEAFFAMVVIGSLPGFLMVVNCWTGACFAAGPASLRKGGKRTVCALALLVAWQYYVYMYVWHFPRVTGKTTKECLWTNPFSLLKAALRDEKLAVYHAAMTLWIVSWVRAIRCDVSSDKLRSELAKAEAAGDDELFEWKKKKRAVGTRTCREIGGVPVPGFDHYCPLINNAVGRRNRKLFILTLAFQLVSGWCLLTDGVPVAVDYWSRDWAAGPLEVPQIAIGVVLSLHINLVSLFLLSVQMLVLPFSISSIELWTLLPWQDANAGFAPRKPSWPSIQSITRELGPFWLWPIPTVN